MRSKYPRYPCSACGDDKPAAAFPVSEQVEGERICRKCVNEREVQEAGGKVCRQCETFYPLAKLVKCHTATAGRRAMCRPCARIVWQERRRRKCGHQPARVVSHGEDVTDYARRMELSSEELAIARRAYTRWGKPDPSPLEIVDGYEASEARRCSILAAANLMARQQTGRAV